MRKILLLSLVFYSSFSLCMSGRADFSFTGNLSTDFASDEIMGSRDGITVYFTWNDNYIYIGWHGGNSQTKPYDRYIFAIDVDPGGSNGPTEYAGLRWNGPSQDNKNKPDFVFEWEKTDAGSTQWLSVSNGSSWSTNPMNYTQFIIVGYPETYEVKIPWTALGGSQPNSFSIWLWNADATGGYVWAIFPTDISGGNSPQTVDSKWNFNNTGTAQSPNLVVSTPLPVELASFTAEINKANEVQLNWSTATEVNSLKFDVQRSSDKNNWTVLGSVNAAGNSNTKVNYSYTDKSRLNQGVYYYRLKQYDNDGISKELNTIEVDYNNIPMAFELNQNYPNPFNPNTVISYSLPFAAEVKLIVYNSLGQTVKVLEKRFKNAGSYSVNLNAADLSSGTYFYKLESGQFTQTKKMIFLK